MTDQRAYHDYFGVPCNFKQPDPDAAELVATIGQGNGYNSEHILGSASILATLPPTVIAMVQPDEVGRIVMVHRPTVYQMGGDLNGLTIGIIGNTASIILHATSFERVQGTRTPTHTTLRTLLTAVNTYVGPYPDSCYANSANVNTRCGMVLPSSWAARAVEPTSWSTAEFYDEFLLPLVGRADEAFYTEWFGWWCAASTFGPGHSQPLVQAATVLTLRAKSEAQGWMMRRLAHQDLLNVAAPVAAGILTNAGVTAKVGVLNTTLTAQEAARVAWEVASKNRSFT